MIYNIILYYILYRMNMNHRRIKRKLSCSRTLRSRKHAKVKLEIPDDLNGPHVDLDAPMSPPPPPPSPGDDPLLLSGSLEPPSPCSDSHLPPARPLYSPRPLRRTVSPPSQPLHGLPFSPPYPDHWTDSDDDHPPQHPSPTKHGEGEFTGKFLELLVKTKKDEWRSPKRFFPLSLEKSPFPLSREKRWARSLSMQPPVSLSSPPSAERAFRRMGNTPVDLDDEGPSYRDEESLHHDEESLHHDEVLPHRDEDPSYPDEEPSHHDEPSFHEGELSYHEEPSYPDEEPSFHQEEPSSPDKEPSFHQEEPSSPDKESSHHNEDPSYPDEEPSYRDEESPHHNKVSSYHDEVLPHHDEPSFHEGELSYHDEDEVLPRHEEPSYRDEESLHHNEMLPHHEEETSFHEGEPSYPDEEPFHSPLQQRDNTTTPFETEISIEIEHDSSDQDPPPDSETWASPDLVKITSADPRAAARAAAILKKHNYDCFTRRQMKKRYSDISRPRTWSPASIISTRGVLSGGVEKQRRKTMTQVMGVRGEKVYIPGSPTTTLPNLLKQAEAEVSLASPASPNPFLVTNSYNTPPPTRVLSPQTQGWMTALANKMNTTLVLTPKVPMTPGEMCYDPLSGTRMWTKEEWKRLDACFTDERLQVGMGMGLRGDDTALVQGTIDGWETWEGMASVDQVDLDNVVARFVDWMGGWDQVNGYGPEWSR